jgi:hypothetical protein
MSIHGRYGGASGFGVEGKKSGGSSHVEDTLSRERATSDVLVEAAADVPLAGNSLAVGKVETVIKVTI